MMLAMLGALQFELEPFNMTSHDHKTAADYASKPVVGRRPLLEFVGEGAETFTLSCKLFPERFGGLGDLSNLHEMRQSGEPQFFMRGDGVPMGFFAVTEVTEKSTYLNPTGVGRVIEVDVSIERTDPPGLDSLFSSFL